MVCLSVNNPCVMQIIHTLNKWGGTIDCKGGTKLSDAPPIFVSRLLYEPQEGSLTSRFTNLPSQRAEEWRESARFLQFCLSLSVIEHCFARKTGVWPELDRLITQLTTVYELNERILLKKRNSEDLAVSTSLLNIMFGVTEIIHLCWLVSVVVGRNGRAQQWWTLRGQVRTDLWFNIDALLSWQLSECEIIAVWFSCSAKEHP